MSLLNGEASPIVIRSNRLAVEIAAPGTAYKRTRFDWTGFITQVTLDAKHTFCAPEDEDPSRGTGGIGLCNEFGIEKPVGYDEAKPGQQFPKIGIGLLTRPDEEPYKFFRPYEIAQRFPIHVDAAPDQVRFVVDPLECRGYAVRETKTVRVDGNFLHIDYELLNSGSEPIDTHEYCHNFISIDKQRLSPDYNLNFPYPVVFEEMDSQTRRQLNLNILQVDGREIHWKSTPKRPFYCRPLGFTRTSQPQWELIYEPGDVGMREYDDFAPERVAVWGTGHVVSAEIFIGIHLPPGQSHSWTRHYQFFD